MNVTQIQCRLPEPWFLLEHLSFADGFHTEFHRHPVWQLSVSLEGTFVYHAAGRKILSSPGEWILLSPDLEHDVGAKRGPAKALQVFFRKFPAAVFPELARGLNPRRNMILTGAGNLTRFIWLAEDFLLARTAVETVSSPLGIMLATTLELVSLCTRKLPEKLLSASALDPRLAGVVEFMERHYMDTVGISEFASVAGFSQRRFSERFKEELKDTPMHYLNSLRLGRAQELLLKGCRVKETAEKCGFASPQYFCRFFLRHTGTTPAEFQRSPFGVGDPCSP